MNEACFSELRVMLDDEFTGRITLHVDKGCVKKVEQNRTWRPTEGRGVEITEVSGGT